MSNEQIEKWVNDKNRKYMSQFYGDKPATSEYRVEHEEGLGVPWVRRSSVFVINRL